jgi:hypothetical protein
MAANVSRRLSATVRPSRDALPAIRVRPLALSAAVAEALAEGLATVQAGHALGASLVIPGCEDAVFMSGPRVGLFPAHIVVRARDLDRVLDAAATDHIEPAGADQRLALHIDVRGVRVFRPRLAPNPEEMRSDCARTNVDATARWLCAIRAPLGLGQTATQLLAPDSHWQKYLTALQGAAPVAESALRRLLGRGAGTTPAGDDLVVGALAHAWVTLGREAPLVAAMGLLNAELPALTSTVGTTYLRAAARGEFGSHLIAWVRALPRVPTQRALALAGRVAGHGETSGYDTLLGFIAAAGAARAA